MVNFLQPFTSSFLHRMGSCVPILNPSPPPPSSPPSLPLPPPLQRMEGEKTLLPCYGNFEAPGTETIEFLDAGFFYQFSISVISAYFATVSFIAAPLTRRDFYVRIEKPSGTIYS
jgi:hypothetical protein